MKCSYKDQVIDFKINSNSQNKNLSVYFGNLICPSCNEICKNHIKCPAESMKSAHLIKVNPENNYYHVSHLKSHKEASFLNEQHTECLRIILNTASKINCSSYFLVIFYFIRIFFF